MALALTACGSGGRHSHTVSSSSAALSAAIDRNPPNNTNGAGGKLGGTLYVLTDQRSRHLDPGQADDAVDFALSQATQRPLYSYLPNQPTIPVPDLAAGPPIVSANDHTLTVDIRPGVHFSPPVGREVTAADVVYALDRGFNPHVANPYERIYLRDVLGGRTATGGPIPGIQATGRFQVTLRFSRRAASRAVPALVLPVSAPVPEEYAARYDANSPSDYADFQVATGPYMIAHNAAGGIVGAGYRPGRRIVLVRNPNWDPGTDFRPGYLDRIVWYVGVSARVGPSDVLNGNAETWVGPTYPSVIQYAQAHLHRQVFMSVDPGRADVFARIASGPSAFASRPTVWSENVNCVNAVWDGGACDFDFSSLKNS